MADKPWADGTFFTDGTGWNDPFENFEQTLEYLAMRDVAKELLFAVEIDAYEPATDAVTRHRFGTRDFTGSTPIKYFVEGRVMSNFSIRRVIPNRDGRWGGLVQLQIGSLELSNADGELDALAETAIDGRRVAVLFSVATRDPFGNSIVPDFDDFIPIYTTEAEGWTFTEDRLRIKLKDSNAALKTPIQTNVYAGIGGSEGHSELQDVRRPISFGENKFVAPVLVDPFDLVYQVSTRPIADIDIFDGGVRLVTTRSNYGSGPVPGASLPTLPEPIRVGSYADLLSVDLSPGNAAVWLQGGYFRLATRPIFVITAHCYERDPDSAQSSTIGALIESILETMSVFNYDNASLQVEPYVRRGGYYLEGGATATAADVIDDLAWSIGGIFGTSRTGTFTSFPIRDPDAVEPELIFAEDEIHDLERVELPYGIPPHQWRVHYDRIWRPHSESEVTGFSEGYENQVASVIGATSNDIVEISLPVAEWRGTVGRESPNIKAIHPTSAPKETYSYVRSFSDAAQAGESFLTLYTPGRRLFRIVVKTALFLLDPGMIVEIRAQRWGLQNGMRGIILELEDDVGSNLTEILLFGGASSIPFAAPDNRVLPAIGGVAKVGQVLQCSIGTWWAHPLPEYDFQWLRNGNPIDDATGQSYILITADLGTDTISCRVTASNSEGIAQATTPAVTVSPADIPPENIVAPALSGTPLVGETLSCSTGTWTGSPAPTFSFQWFRSTFPILGATSAFYVPVSVDVGTNISCRVRAANIAGSAEAATSAVLISTGASVPVNTSLPVITGTAEPGGSLTCSTGTWTGSPTPSFSFQWLRNGATISGAVSSTYVPVSGDVDENISCRVTATNSAGSAQATAAAVLISTGTSAPVNTDLPVISGTAEVGQTLSCSNGTWSGSPTPTFSFQWLNDGAAISGATSSTYVLASGDEGDDVSCRVTATNSAGSASATSATRTVAAAPSDFPVVYSISEQQFSDNTNNHNVRMPSTITAGDLLMIFFTHRNDASVVAFPGDWTALGWTAKYINVRSGAGKTTLLIKVAAGNEDGTTVNVRTDSQRTGAAQVYRIKNWFGALSGVQVSSPVTGTGLNPSPPNLTSSWGALKNLFIVMCSAADDDATVSSYPAGYSFGRDTISGAVAHLGSDLGCSVATARRNLEQASVSPGNFSLNKDEQWVAHTIVIRPA